MLAQKPTTCRPIRQGIPILLLPVEHFFDALFFVSIGFKIKILDALSVVNVRRVRLPPSSLPKIFILKSISDVDHEESFFLASLKAALKKPHENSGSSPITFMVPFLQKGSRVWRD
jgi:hypothetical protein